jgi:hypothetical protein
VVHVISGALEDFYVTLLLAEDHVLMVTLLCRQEGITLSSHLDESLAGWLTLGVQAKMELNYE